MKYDTKNIRNVALYGHSNSGKTTLNEAMLFTAGSIPEKGKIETGNTVSDYMDLEISKKISIHSSISFLEWNNSLVNIIDTPGSADFVGDVVASMAPANSGLFVVNAESGVEIETIKIWRKCNLPKLVFINKMDKDNANFEKCLTHLKESFKGVTFVPLNIPIGEGKDFKGVVDLIDREARYFEENGKKIRKEKAPDNITGLDVHYKEMLETAVESDENLMNKYFNDEALTHDEVVMGLKKSIITGTIVPVMCGNASNNSGIIALLDAITNYMPSPADRNPSLPEGEQDPNSIIEDASNAPAVFIFKTTIDQFAGKISYFVVKRGHVTSDMELLNVDKNIKEKCGKLFKPFGKNLKDVDNLSPGDIGAFTKLANTGTNDTLADVKSPISLPKIDLPQVIFSQAITTKEKKDEEKLIALLQKISEEDPTFKIEYNAETKQNVISGMGETQIKIFLDKIKDKNKIETILLDTKIAYRETIRKKATAEYTHKKQSGGHGQYAKVAIDIYPIEVGKYYEFVNAIVGGAIGKGYIPGCEKGFHEAMDGGVLAGYKVVDVGIRLFDGKEHDVDSSEMSFKIASRNAFKEAMKNANPVLLEPIMELTVYAENKYIGDILSDLNSKRGRVSGQETLSGGLEVIKASVPHKELLRYAIDLKSITSGTGSFEMSFYNYQPLTGKLADDIVAARKKEIVEEKDDE